MVLSNLYKSTKTKVATSLAALTLAGGIVIATPVYGRNIPNPTQTEFTAQVDTYDYEGPREFRDRYGEIAFQELMNIQQKYQLAMQSEGVALTDSAKTKVISYLGEENIENIESFVAEVQQEAMGFVIQNAPTIQGLVTDVEAALNGNTDGLEANIEKYIPVIQGAVNLAKENVTEFYQDNQVFVDRIVADVQATFNDPELIAAINEYQQGMKVTLTTQFIDFYQRNEQLMQRILGDARSTFTDEEFLGEIQIHQDVLGRAILKGIMGKEFVVQADSAEVRIERLDQQLNREIHDLIERLEKQRALQKDF